MEPGFLEKWVHTGTFSLYCQDDEITTVGNGPPHAHVHLRKKSVLRRLLHNPDIAMGEAYMDGDWWPGEGGLVRVFELYFANGDPHPLRGIRALLRRLMGLAMEANNQLRASRNIQHHYDLDTELFRRFLDQDMHYSCAYFESPDYTLEQAQQAKCRHIGQKLLLQPGQRVLDIGSGWGGMALYLARRYDIEVTGLTLSQDQYDESTRRAAQQGLQPRVRFLLQDYREHQDEYDAIVSVGMFEHVGRPQYQVFFDQVENLLAADGRALIHSIGRLGPPCDSRGWIQRYIFPGGYIPALSEVARPIENSGLVLSDLEIWRLHYAETLRHWNLRFQADRDHFAQRLGERFCRMWEYYLIGCEGTFRWGDLAVFQLQLGANNSSVPLTRDYLYAAGENAMGAQGLAG